MATTYVVQAVFNGTSLRLPVSARTPASAASKAAKSRLTKSASAYIVFDRGTGQPVYTQTASRFDRR